MHWPRFLSISLNITVVKLANGLLGLVSAQYNRLHRTTVNTDAVCFTQLDNNKFKRFCLVGLSLCNPINGMFLLLMIKNNN